MVGTAPGPGGHCEECKQPLTNKTAFREHMKTHHGWQKVVCPLCPTWRERKNPSGLTKHIKKEHAGATWPAALLEMALLYFFSVRPVQYRRISQIREAADKDTDTALEMIGRWASIVSEPRAHELVQRIQSDWAAHLQAVTSKQKCGAPKVTPPPPKWCRNLLDLTLLDMVLSARCTCQATLWSTLPGYTGELKVEFRLTQTPYRKATRVMEILMDAERLTLGDVSDVPQTISSPGLMQEVAATVGIHPTEMNVVQLREVRATVAPVTSPGPVPPVYSPRSDASSSPFSSRPVSPLSSSPLLQGTAPDASSIPALAAMLAGIEDVPFEHAEPSVDLVELAAHPPPPPDEARVPEVSVAHLEDDPVAHQLDMNIVPKDIPLPPETRTSVHLEEIPLPPNQDCQVREPDEPVERDEGQEELPKTQTMPLPLGIEMQGPPVDIPVPRVPVDQLVMLPLPPPNYSVTPFGKVHADYVPTNTKKQALPTEGPAPLPAADQEVLKWGAWPLLCPGRRDWAAGPSLDLQLLISSICWPPSNWRAMSPNQRRFVLQAVAGVMALGDSKEGEFPIQPPEQLAEDYNMLALPGTGSSGKGHLSQLRLAAHTSLKHSAAAAPEVHEGLLVLLRPGKNQGPKARNKVLAAVNEAQVPLLPYHRPSHHLKAYDSTKPGLTE